MTVMEHLDELRKRLVRVFIGFGVAFAVCFFLFDIVIEFISEPYLALIGEDQLTVLGPVDTVGLKLKVVSYMAIAITIPYALFEVYRFVAPGLTKREKRWTLPLIPASFVFFCIGVYIGYLTMPKALEFIVGFAGDSVTQIPDANRYLGFVTFMLLAFGITFQFPLVLLLLQAANIADWRALLGFWRYAIVLIVIFAAIITPSQDPYSLALMVVPMVVFYFGSIGVGYLLFGRRRTREASEL